MSAENSKVLKIHCPGCGQKLDVSDLPAFHRFGCPSCHAEVIVPRRFGEFTLEEPIGAGGMARVYRALHVTLDREVAVKILREEMSAAPECVSLFLAEARQAAAVNHPNIAPIYSSGAEESQPYLVMQYMAGGSLAGQIEQHGAGVPVHTCLRMVRDTARGLEAAYRHGLVHHDVKPGNILLDGDGNIKVGDFGLAQALGTAGRGTTGEGAQFLTPCYVSPEKAASGEEDFRGDIFSLGATFYHLVTGRPPWPGGELADILKARAAGPAVPVVEVRPEAPAGVGALIEQMMSEAVESRPATYGEIIAELNRLLKSSRTVLQTEPDGVDRARATRRVVVSAGTNERLGRGGRSIAPRRGAFAVNLGIALGVLLMLTALVLGARRRAPWYTRYVAPLVSRVFHRARPTPDVTSTGQTDGTKPVRKAASAVQPAASGAGETIPSTDTGSGPPPGKHLIAGGTAKSPGHLPDAAALFGMASGTADETPVGNAERVSVPPIAVATRPRPAGLNFAGAKAALDRHLARQTPEGRKMEEKRLQVLQGSRAYLVQLMKYMPFQAGAGGIELQSGQRLQGSIPLCNDDGITVKAPRSSALRHVTWTELSFEQIVAFFAYYIDLRLGRERPELATGTEGNPKLEAAQDCFRLALLCDWYGEADAARHWGTRATELMPKLAPTIKKYVPTHTR